MVGAGRVGREDLHGVVMIVSRQQLAEQFASRKFIEVPAPELGEGCVARFRSVFTVNDLATVVQTKGWNEDLILDVVLAHLALVDEDGGEVFRDDDAKFFGDKIDAVLLCRLSKRARLKERFVQAWRGGVGGGG